ncbi:helix-turn-helix domain-containing protein [Planococcus sp. ANT_H30]|uniref:helix-turn-helix domain-containing protein n=1 Tax=Planococcus sp. ANT_H30 TaxID=2597347 RepID=UPI00165EA8B8|nr:helix-turn-helix domain-containing protein [Planococcus sp. ANT_H30]
MFIYSITNQQNQKKYIGISLYPLDVRKQYHATHQDQLRSLLQSTASSSVHSIDSLSKLAQAFVEYDMNQFTWERLESCKSIRELCKRQRYYITLYDSYEHGYNNIQGVTDISVFEIDDTPIEYAENDGHFTTAKTRGSANVNSKLTFENVQQIKKLLSERVLSQAKIANKFNVSKTTIGKINKGVSYIEDEYTSVSTSQPQSIASGRAIGFTPEQIENINNHIKAGQHTKKELQEILNLSEHKLKTFIKKLKDAGHAIKFKNPNPALSDEQAREIKLLIQSGSMSQNEIAEQYAVSKTVIHSIRKGETYQHIVI